MAKFNFGGRINYIPFSIKNFLGVDFQNNPSEVAYNRSPDALNVLSSESGIIEKRTGYEILNTFAGGAKINGIHIREEVVVNSDFTVNMSAKQKAFYVHVGTQLWRIQGAFAWRMAYYTYTLENTFPEIVDPEYCVLSDTPSLFIENNDGFYIVCNGKILNYYTYQPTPSYWLIFFNDWLVSNYFNTSYVPTTVIARAPTGGGTTYEAINAIQPRRKNSFLGTAGTLTYQLDTTGIDAVVAETYSWGTGGLPTDTGKVTAQILQANGTYTTITEGAGLTVNRSTGVVTFSTAPSVTPITGQDNVIIQFYKKKVVAGDPAYNISRSTVFSSFGLNGSDDYIFLGNSKDRPNYDYYGRSVDMYFPDTAYTKFGSSQSKIMGYSRMGEYMVVHKDSEAEEKTIYLRSATLDTDNEIIFPVKIGISGVGAISKRSFQSFHGEPVFLSNEGVMSLVSNNVTDVKSAQNRGFYINNRLLTETGLADAVSIIYDNKYMIFVNGKVYVADPRYKGSERDSYSESYQFEWYYWSGIDAKQVFEYEGTLYFGTSDGKLCRLRKKGETNAHLDNATAVSGYWCTPVLFMDDITVKKSLKNLWLKMQQYLTSQVKVYYRCRGTVTLVKDKEFDTPSFAGLDYNRLTFETNKDAEVIVTNRVERQFSSIQFKFLNDANENFGLIEVIGKYRVNSAYKGS